MASEALSLWETQPLGEGPLTCAMFSSATEPRSGFMRRDLGQRSAAFRFLLPAGEPAAAPKPLARAAESRPEYYDFDLFRYGDSARELDERRLSIFPTRCSTPRPRASSPRRR